jgi:hypothetical protein
VDGHCDSEDFYFPRCAAKKLAISEPTGTFAHVKNFKGSRLGIILADDLLHGGVTVQ